MAAVARIRTYNSQLAELATLIEHFTGEDRPRVLAIARGYGQDTRTPAGSLLRRQHAESQDLEHPSPVARGRHICGTQWKDGGTVARCVAWRSRPAKRAGIAGFAHAHAAPMIPSRPGSTF